MNRDDTHYRKNYFILNGSAKISIHPSSVCQTYFYLKWVAALHLLHCVSLSLAEWWQTCSWPYLPTCLACHCSCWLCYITTSLSITPRSRSRVPQYDLRGKCNLCWPKMAHLFELYQLFLTPPFLWLPLSVMFHFALKQIRFLTQCYISEFVE